jgi:hypothetical protein
MQLDQNPYAAPSLDEPLPLVKNASGEPTAREVFLAWEKLRLYYNAILAGLSLFLGLPRLASSGFWYTLFQGALIANLCFCLGVALEGYAALFGIPRRPMRLLLFFLGTCLAGGLAVLAIAGRI